MSAAEQQEQKPVALAKPVSAIMASPLDVGLVVRPQNFGELVEYAKLVSQSGMVPKDYVGNPGAVIVAMQMGAELGLTPMAALQNIAVINGRPSLWGDVGLALVKVHRDFVKIVETKGDGWAKCVISRKDEPDVEHTFTVEDAKKANLWGKSGPWTNYPKRMLQMRARWFSMRDQFPDVFKGVHGAEEAIDMPPAAPWPAAIGAVAPLPPNAVITQDEPKRDVSPIVNAFESIGVSRAMLEAKLQGRKLEDLDDDGFEWLRKLHAEVKQSPKKKAEAFGQAPAVDVNARFSKQPDPEVDEKALAAAAAEAEEKAKAEQATAPQDGRPY